MSLTFATRRSSNVFFGAKKLALTSCLALTCASVGGVALTTAARAGTTHPASAATLSATVHPAIWPSVKWPFAPDPALEKRVHSLLSRMTVEEKVGQIIQANIMSVTPAQVRKYHLGAVLAGGDSGINGKHWGTPKEWLHTADAYYRASVDTSHGGAGIPILFGLDAVHGDGRMLGATIFPQHSALGNARDPELIREIARATAQELRASGIDWAFAPTLTVPQDDRWGRTYEGYSENPAVVASYAAAAVEGLQGKPGTPSFLDASHVIASAKHYIGDGSTKNGKDQGDAEVSEKALRDIAGAGFPPAIAAGAQTVMASYSSWNGVKMTGDKGLLTDVLKKRMHFGGFIVGDWNSHGQVKGCTDTDCPEAINAGLDMFMAPDSWKGLYTNTLAEVKKGVIPMSRLDDAVSRILRVKLRLGLFDQGAPSTQPMSGKFNVIGGPAHRKLARRAVRESLVLLKNDNHLLPINPREHILVTGEGANSIPMQSGGWTLTWQGTGTTNADFPNGISIWGGIKKQVKAAGGTAELSVDGKYKTKPDVAIVVYGEHPYAEFHGDIPNLLFDPGNPHDLDLLKRLRKQGIPVVSVFLSGRPLWVNPEINASNAFVAAWLPGSEGDGVADVLLRNAAGKVQYDFHGKLAYSWPRSAVQTPLNVGQKNYHPQFAFGYGLTYKDNGNLGHLSEDSGVKGAAIIPGLYLNHGKPAPNISLRLTGDHGATVTVSAIPAKTADGSVRVTADSYKRQEDARRIQWQGQGRGSVVLRLHASLDLTRQTNGNVMVEATLKIDAAAAKHVRVGIECGAKCGASVPLTSLPPGKWLRVGVSLKCFNKDGVDMSKIQTPFRLDANGKGQVSVSHVALSTDVDKVLACPAH